MPLEIKKPCEASWDDMHREGDGRHCGACQKKVVDFTSLTREEIEAYLDRAPGQVCGRINPAFLLAPLLLAGLPGLAQSDRTRTAVTGGLVTISVDSSRTIRLFVTDGRDPIISACIMVSKTKSGYYTDEQGKATVFFPEGTQTLKIVVSAIGYELEKITLRRSASMKNITLRLHPSVMGDTTRVE